MSPKKRDSTRRRKRIHRNASQLAAVGQTTQSPFIPDMQHLYELMFGTSGDVEQEYKEYQDYWGVDPRNIH